MDEEYLEKPSRVHNSRKDSKHKAKGTKKHTPKVEYDRRDKSWIEEQGEGYCSICGMLIYRDPAHNASVCSCVRDFLYEE